MKNKSLKITRNLFVLAVLVLTGCMTGKDGHTYIDGHCVSCLNNPITGEPYNYSKNSPDYLQAKHYQSKQGTPTVQPLPTDKKVVRFSVNTPVDRAYLKLKHAFGFKTRKQREHSFGADNAWLDVAEEFRYEAIPGVSYHMREHIGHSYQGVRNQHTIDVLLETNGSGTDIVLTYWVAQPHLKTQSYGQSIKARALRALR